LSRPLLLVGPSDPVAVSVRIFGDLPNSVIFDARLRDVSGGPCSSGNIQTASVGVTALLASIWSVLVFPSININLRDQPQIR
jgi:hypothetical protein